MLNKNLIIFGQLMNAFDSLYLYVSLTYNEQQFNNFKIITYYFNINVISLSEHFDA